ncbi:MAG: corrinoid protein [Armatimonadetes bacterium]|nr:corrinoid protein [Armatimonadota bacterium]
MDFSTLSEAIINGNRDVATKETQAAVDAGVPASDILQEGLIAGMSVVGQKFKANEFYVPEVLVAARAMKSSMGILRPLLAEANVQAVAKVAIGTVQGDLHDIGKNLVAMMLEGAGFEIIDLGVDCSPDKFMEAVKQNGASVIALSALLTTTMPSMKDTVEVFKQAGLREQVKIMVGGAPLTQDYADSIGADGYAPDAASAVDLAKDLIAA